MKQSSYRGRSKVSFLFLATVVGPRSLVKPSPAELTCYRQATIRPSQLVTSINLCACGPGKYREPVIGANVERSRLETVSRVQRGLGGEEELGCWAAPFLSPPISLTYQSHIMVSFIRHPSISDPSFYLLSWLTCTVSIC